MVPLALCDCLAEIPFLSSRVLAVPSSASKNGFVQEALEAALKVSTAMGKPPRNNLLVDIVGDNDFYSQERTVTPVSRRVLPSRCPFQLNSTSNLPNDLPLSSLKPL